MNFALQIQSLVVAPFEDYDLQPITGVREPLSARLKEFRIIGIGHCEQLWIGRQTNDKCHKILRKKRYVA